MANVYETSDFRNGLKVLVDGQPFAMIYFQFVKPGKGTAFTWTKMKNLLTGQVIERTYRTGDTLEAADCEDVEMQYTWNDGETFYFQNTETFDEVPVSKLMMDGSEDFLTDDIIVSITMFNSRPVAVTLPNFIEAKVTYAEPGAKGNTATNATKNATLSTGATIQVPLFVETDEVIRVDTRTREYVSRVNTK